MDLEINLIDNDIVQKFTDAFSTYTTEGFTVVVKVFPFVVILQYIHT